jgi:succinate dehydrogenase / fumarate reductase flavoprotein subunit
MMDKVSVVRDATGMAAAKETIADLRHAYGHIALQDKGKTFNTDLTEALELGCMLDVADAMINAALRREESRGAHHRADFPEPDDSRWLRYVVVRSGDASEPDLETRPVLLGRGEEAARGAAERAGGRGPQEPDSPE